MLLHVVPKDGDREERAQIPYLLDQTQKEFIIPVTKKAKIDRSITKSMEEKPKDGGKEETDEIPPKMDKAEVKGIRYTSAIKSTFTI